MRAARGVPDPGRGCGAKRAFRRPREYTEPEEASTCFGGHLRFLLRTIAEGPSALSSDLSMTSPQTAEPGPLSKRPKIDQAFFGRLIETNPALVAACDPSRAPRLRADLGRHSR